MFSMDINRLPPEVLSEIFIHHRYVDSELNWSRRYQWIKITHVCHYWRSIALSSPRLWTTIKPHKNIEVIKEVLIRAKKAPLSVLLDYNGSAPPLDVFELVLAEFSHIEHLNFHINSDILESLIKHFPLQSPQLRSLVFSRYGSSDSEVNKDPWLHLLEECDTSKLTKLEVSGYNIAWAAKPLPSTLTRLVVSISSHKDSNKLSLPELITALSDAPSIEHLALHYTIKRGVANHDDCSAIESPRLKRFIVEDIGRSIVSLLPLIKMPSAAEKHITFAGSEAVESPDTLARAARAIAALVQGTYLTLSVAHPVPGENKVAFGFWEEDYAEYRGLLISNAIGNIMTCRTRILKFTYHSSALETLLTPPSTGSSSSPTSFSLPFQYLPLRLYSSRI